MTLKAYEARGRAIKLASTYLRKSESMLYMDLPLDPAYWDLLDQALGTAYEILGQLSDDFFETTQSEGFFGLPGGPVNLSDTAHETVEKIVQLLDHRRKVADLGRRISLLEQVAGRSPEEAAAYLAKAAELRRKMNT